MSPLAHLTELTRTRKVKKNKIFFCKFSSSLFIHFFSNESSSPRHTSPLFGWAPSYSSLLFFACYLSCSLCGVWNKWKRATVTLEAGGQEEEEQPDLVLILPSLFFTVSLQAGHHLPAVSSLSFLTVTHQLSNTHACTHVTSFSHAPAFVSLCFLLIFHPARLPACPGITSCSEITHNEIGIQPL